MFSQSTGFLLGHIDHTGPTGPQLALAALNWHQLALTALTALNWP